MTGLMDVPAEVVLEHLLPALPVKALGTIAQVNKHFNSLAVGTNDHSFSRSYAVHELNPDSQTRHYGSISHDEISHSHPPSSLHLLRHSTVASI